VETSAGGRAVRRLDSHPPTPGDKLVLSVDIRLQALVEEMFGDRRGALVALDPRNGEVLAFVSKPTFDPNLFVDGIDSESWRELNESIDKPLLNRALRGTYPPGDLQALHGDGRAEHRQAQPGTVITTAAPSSSATTPSAATATTAWARWTWHAPSSRAATSTTTRWPTRWAWT
jgi:hypothetical protein